ncbi:MAG: rod shape-determining protein RodA [Verrucomicrobiae bacterium]|jgi:rod shape determining protein RodA|nr:rod shape-determining protein RodA [Verrucomicrobiae bacterium]
MENPRANNRTAPTIDWSIMAAVLCLMVFGAMFIYSARFATEGPDMAFYQRQHFKQIIYYALGLGCLGALCITDYRIMSRYSYVAYWLAILSLIIVLIPIIGAVRGGARRWIDLGFFSLQPSEFAKLALILALANFLSRPTDELRLPGNFGKALGMVALPFFLILMEPDLGSALVLIPVSLAMMYAGNIPTKYLRRLVGGASIVVTLLVVDILVAPADWRVPIEDYQRRRLLVYFDRPYQDFAPPNATPAELKRAREKQINDSYNVKQALISVGSGGLTGNGWRQGKQNALGYLPRAVSHNDFIFSVLAEEIGFIGSVVVIGLYAVIFFIGIRVAAQARDRLGRLVAVGVVTLLFSHVFINIGMNIRLMPVTGVPLPLLSSGGSFTLVSLLAIGLLQNVHRHRRSY